MPAPHKFLLLLMMTSTLLLGACGKKSADAPDAAVQNSVPAGDEAPAANEPEPPKADYWKPVASYLPGSYGGACMRPLDVTKRVNGKMVIATDGKFTFNEFSGNLLTTEQTLFGRSHEANGLPKLIVSAIEKETMLSLTSGDKGVGSIVSFKKDDNNIFTCEQSNDPVGMAAKPMYAVFAGVLESAPHKIDCIMASSMTMSALNYQFKDGLLKIHDQTYDLSKMDETVAITDNFSQFLYSATAADEHNVSVGLDKYGKVMMVLAYAKGGALFSCNKN